MELDIQYLCEFHSLVLRVLLTGLSELLWNHISFESFDKF